MPAKTVVFTQSPDEAYAKIEQTLRMLESFPADPESKEDTALLREVFARFSAFADENIAADPEKQEEKRENARHFINTMFSFAFLRRTEIAKSVQDMAAQWYVQTLRKHWDKIGNPLATLKNLSELLPSIEESSSRFGAVTLIKDALEKPFTGEKEDLGHKRDIAYSLAARISDRTEQTEIQIVAAAAVERMVIEGVTDPSSTLRDISSPLYAFQRNCKASEDYAREKQAVAEKVDDIFIAMARTNPMLVPKPALAQAIRKNLSGGPK